jgi:hypothetical protein
LSVEPHWLLTGEGRKFQPGLWSSADHDRRDRKYC